MTSAITKVGEKHALHIDQMGQLNTEVGYVMMGLTPAADLPGIIEDDFGIEEEKAQAIAKDIDEMLFTKIRDSMKQVVAPTPPVINAPSQKPPLSSILPTPTAPIAAMPSTPTTSAPSVSPAPKPLMPAAPMPTSIEMPPKKVVEKLEVKQADMMLSEPTITKTPEIILKTSSTTAPPKPQGYKADPYREPAN
jgi:hypothetical protein